MREATIREILISRGEELVSRPFEPVRFTGHTQADELLNDLQGYPHAFVLACIMDRQIRAEKAWLIPYEVKQRLGSFEFADLASLSLDGVRVLMTEPHSLHRFVDQMAVNLHSALQRIAGEYSGDASALWADRPASATVVRRFLEFRGVGPKIATMAANILVRNFKIDIREKISIDISPDVHVRRVFARLGLILDRASNEVLVYRAREMNPLYPGIFDLPAWEIGRSWCRPKNPNCQACFMNVCCPRAAEQS